MKKRYVVKLVREGDHIAIFRTANSSSVVGLSFSQAGILDHLKVGPGDKFVFSRRVLPRALVLKKVCASRLGIDYRTRAGSHINICYLWMNSFFGPGANPEKLYVKRLPKRKRG